MDSLWPTPKRVEDWCVLGAAAHELSSDGATLVNRVWNLDSRSEFAPSVGGESGTGSLRDSVSGESGAGRLRGVMAILPLLLPR